MKAISINEIKSSLLKNGNEFQCGNFRVGYTGQFYYAGSLFYAIIYRFFDTVQELREFLTVNKK